MTHRCGGQAACRSNESPMGLRSRSCERRSVGRATPARLRGMAEQDLQALLDDLYEQLSREYDVDIGPWDAIAKQVMLGRPHLMAVVFAPSDGVQAQAFFRPMDDLRLAILAANEVKHRLERLAAGDPEVFESYADGVNRRMALIYNLAPGGLAPIR